MPLRMSARDVLGDERMWAYGAGERWTAPRPIPPEPTADNLPTKTIIPGEGEINAPRDSLLGSVKRKLGIAPKNYRRSDERILDHLCQHLWDESQVDLGDVSVEAKDGLVTLAGTVPSRRMKHLIEDIAAGTFGVHDVENRIRVRRD